MCERFKHLILITLISLYENIFSLRIEWSLFLKTGNRLTSLCEKFGWIWPSGSGEGDFYISSMYFSLIYPWKNAWPFIWTSFNSYHPILLRTKLGCNWPNGSVVQRSHRCRRSGFDPGQDRPGSDSSTAKRSATGASFTCPRIDLHRIGNSSAN